MLEQMMLFAPGFVLGLVLSAVLAALGVLLRLRDEALSAFSHAQVAVLGAMIAAITGLPALIGAWGLAMLAASVSLWAPKPATVAASSGPNTAPCGPNTSAAMSWAIRRTALSSNI